MSDVDSDPEMMSRVKREVASQLVVHQSARGNSEWLEQVRIIPVLRFLAQDVVKIFVCSA